MKNFTLSIVALMALSSNLMAGGDIVPVEPMVGAPIYEDSKDAEGLYVGLAYSHLSHDLDYQGKGSFAEVDHNGFMVNLGYKFNPYIAVEGRYQTNIGNEENNEDDNDPESHNENSEITVISLFVKPMYPLAPEFDIYGLLGYSLTDSSNTHFNNGGYNNRTSIDEGSFSWGAGGSYVMTEDFSVFGEYTQFYSDTLNGFDHVIDSFNIGIVFTF